MNIELVASFANRSNLLKEWEKTDICAVSAYGAHGPKNAAITRIPDHALPRSPTHFSDRTALVCSGCLPPWPMREAPALRKTRNQFYVNAVYGPGARNYTRWKNPEFLTMLDQQSRELDRDKRRQILRKMEEFLLTVEDPYIPINWKPWPYLVSNKVRTEVGPFVVPNSIQNILKNEHLWVEK